MAGTGSKTTSGISTSTTQYGWDNLYSPDSYIVQGKSGQTAVYGSPYWWETLTATANTTFYTGGFYSTDAQYTIGISALKNEITVKPYTADTVIGGTGSNWISFVTFPSPLPAYPGGLKQFNQPTAGNKYVDFDPSRGVDPSTHLVVNSLIDGSNKANTIYGAPGVVVNLSNVSLASALKPLLRVDSGSTIQNYGLISGLSDYLESRLINAGAVDGQNGNNLLASNSQNGTVNGLGAGQYAFYANNGTNNYAVGKLSGIQNVQGSNSASNLIVAGAGNGILQGGTKDDIIVGGTGNNNIYGMGGHDLLVSTVGNDTMYAAQSQHLGQTTPKITVVTDSSKVTGVTMIAGTGIVTMVGSDVGDDYIIVGKANNTIYGSGLGASGLGSEGANGTTVNAKDYDTLSFAQIGATYYQGYKDLTVTVNYSDIYHQSGTAVGTYRKTDGSVATLFNDKFFDIEHIVFGSTKMIFKDPTKPNGYYPTDPIDPGFTGGDPGNLNNTSGLIDPGPATSSVTGNNPSGGNTVSGGGGGNTNLDGGGNGTNPNTLNFSSNADGTYYDCEDQDGSTGNVRNFSLVLDLIGQKYSYQQNINGSPTVYGGTVKNFQSVTGTVDCSDILVGKSDTISLTGGGGIHNILYAGGGIFTDLNGTTHATKLTASRLGTSENGGAGYNWVVFQNPTDLINGGNLSSSGRNFGGGRSDASYAGGVNADLDPTYSFTLNGVTYTGDMTGFANILGTAGNDTITGDANVNILVGAGGNDDITGLGNTDVFYGGAGLNTITGKNSANETFVVGYDYNPVADAAYSDTGDYGSPVPADAITANMNGEVFHTIPGGSVSVGAVTAAINTGVDQIHGWNAGDALYVSQSGIAVVKDFDGAVNTLDFSAAKNSGLITVTAGGGSNVTGSNNLGVRGTIDTGASKVHVGTNGMISIDGVTLSASSGSLANFSTLQWAKALSGQSVTGLTVSGLTGTNAPVPEPWSYLPAQTQSSLQLATGSTSTGLQLLHDFINGGGVFDTGTPGARFLFNGDTLTLTETYTGLLNYYFTDEYANLYGGAASHVYNPNVVLYSVDGVSTDFGTRFDFSSLSFDASNGTRSLTLDGVTVTAAANTGSYSSQQLVAALCGGDVATGLTVSGTVSHVGDHLYAAGSSVIYTGTATPGQAQFSVGATTVTAFYDNSVNTGLGNIPQKTIWDLGGVTYNADFGGNDYIKVLDGGGTIDAGGGNNTVVAGNGNYTITVGDQAGDLGTNNVYTGSGKNTISLGGLNNSVYLSSFNTQDDITGWTTNDRLVLDQTLLHNFGISTGVNAQVQTNFYSGDVASPYVLGINPTGYSSGYAPVYYEGQNYHPGSLLSAVYDSAYRLTLSNMSADNGAYTNSEYFGAKVGGIAADSAVAAGVFALAMAMYAIPFVGPIIAAGLLVLDGFMIYDITTTRSYYNPIYNTNPDNGITFAANLGLLGLNTANPLVGLSNVMSSHNNSNSGDWHNFGFTQFYGANNSGGFTPSLEVVQHYSEIAGVPIIYDQRGTDGGVLSPSTTGVTILGDGPDGIHTVSLVYSGNYTYVYLVNSSDGLIQNNEARLLARVDGHVTPDQITTFDAKNDANLSGITLANDPKYPAAITTHQVSVSSDLLVNPDGTVATDTSMLYATNNTSATITFNLAAGLGTSPVSKLQAGDTIVLSSGGVVLASFAVCTTGSQTAVTLSDGNTVQVNVVSAATGGDHVTLTLNTTLVSGNPQSEAYVLALKIVNADGFESASGPIGLNVDQAPPAKADVSVTATPIGASVAVTGLTGSYAFYHGNTLIALDTAVPSAYERSVTGTAKTADYIPLSFTNGSSATALAVGQGTLTEINQLKVKDIVGNTTSLLASAGDIPYIILGSTGGGDSVITGNIADDNANHYVYEFHGANTITLGNGNNTIYGGNGVETIIVGTGVNTLQGGLGADVITLGGGTNSLVYSCNDNVSDSYTGAADSVTNFNWTKDKLVISATGVASFDATSADAKYTAGTPGTPGTPATAVFNFHAGNGIEVDFTSDTGYSASNFENAVSYNLTGDSANNTLVGGNLDDSLDGGAGNDTLTGGTGNDTFVFAAGDSVATIGGTGNTGTVSGYDTISDFVLAGVDTLDVAGVGHVATNATLTTDSVLTIGPNVLSSIKITAGNVVFSTANDGSSPVTIDSNAKLAAAIQALTLNDIGEAGDSVYFTATIGATDHTYVYTQAGASVGGDIVDLVGVLATSLITSGTTTGGVFIS